MASQGTAGVQEILTRWRNIVKDKKRQIITPEEAIDQKIASIWPFTTPDSEPVEGWEYRQFRYTRKRERIFEDESWKSFKVGDTWGGPDMSAQFRCKSAMPKRFAGKRVALQLYFSGDGLLCINGAPYHGLDPFRDMIFLTESASGDETYDLDVESYIFWHAGETIIKNFEVSQFVTLDQEMANIYWDLRCAYKVMLTELIEPGVRDYVRAVLDEALVDFDHNETDPTRFREQASRAQAIVRRGLYESDRFQREGLIHMNGNSHLDVCFMWTHAEFVRKIGRTHATTLRLMEQYPDYKFSQSQPLMYEEMKQNWPNIYEQVKERVKEGRWEVIGAFWVEPDCNLISGESFVRQLVHGIRFLREEFGVTPRTAWIPDVFGNMWSLPQICLKSGLKYFVTHKMILWNDTNKWRKNVFWWEGPDGSRIFAHVPPTGFIGTCEPDHMTEHWQNFTDKSTVGESLYNYGWGDGGGGPDAEMLESIKRYQNFPGMTPVTWSFNEEALERMYQKAVAAGDAIPVYNDELYLEEHRGTFTTKGIFKKLNRYCERLYRSAEMFSCFAGGDYPREELREGWKTILTNQFHDSLPGSHVTVVHQDLIESYEAPVATGEKVLADALQGIAAKVDTQGDGDAIVLFNSLPFERSTLVRLPREEADVHLLDADSNPVPHQFIVNAESGKTELVFRAEGIPALGYATYRLKEDFEDPKSPVILKAADTSLENEFIKLTLNEEGEIVSLLDKQTNRECIDPERRGNVFQLYEDEPGRHEAWDIISTYEDLEFDIRGSVELRVAESGPVRAAIELTKTFRDSKIVQRIVLARGSKRVDFETYVDWHEQKKLLKTRFHTTIRSRTATYDIPFANIERPTTRNNSYEAAKFEVPAHQWMDISQADYGLSLLNDCKYGHEAYGSMICLTLLKGPTFPDPVADQGEHWFTYSLYPHGGCWRDGGTVAEALDLNNPVLPILEPAHKGSLAPVHGFMQVDAANVTLEAVKRAEDSNALIVRLVERHGVQNDVTVTLPGTIKKLAECNLLEEEDQPMQASGECFSFTIRPYEIRTFKVEL